MIRAARYISLLLCVSILCVSGCVKKEEDTQEKETKKKNAKIGVTLAAESPYLISVAAAIEETAADKGIEIEVLYADWDISVQERQMKKFIDENVGAIIMAPVHSKAMLTPLKKTKKAGIPVINVNMKVDSISSEYISTYVGSSSLEEGEKAAQMMKEVLGSEGGKVGIIEGTPGSDPQIYRTEGFLDGVESNPEIKIVGIGNGEWEKQKAKLVAIDLIRTNPDVKGIYCQDSEMALGAVEALEMSGKSGEVAVISISENEEYLQALRKGRLTGIVTQPPEFEGEYSVYCAIWAMEGKELQPWYKDPAQCLTKDNVDTYEKNWELY